MCLESRITPKAMDIGGGVHILYFCCMMIALTDVLGTAGSSCQSRARGYLMSLDTIVARNRAQVIWQIEA